ncbi:MAG: right-handed parallel beta-helix repeat-containing protein [bacterium]|nr:right-handed parallel beta-helix repeat-containing protein [Gemmatimonadota bacterium]
MLPPTRPALLLSTLLALVLTSGCGDSDPGTGPDPEPQEPPRIEIFLAESPALLHGDFTRLRWRIDGADVAAITRDEPEVPAIGELDDVVDGAVSIRPHRDVTYTLLASNEWGTSEATATVTVSYPAAVFVDPLSGDDSDTGVGPDHPIASLGEALLRTQGGGAIFLAGGDYDEPLVIDGAPRSVAGALDPATFFEDSDRFRSTIRPTGESPLQIRNAAQGTSLITFVEFDARNGGDVAGIIENSPAHLESCYLNGRDGVSGTGLRIQGTADVTLRGCRISGGRPIAGGTVHTETAGIRVDDSSALLATSCFIDGGRAFSVSSGVRVASTGSVRLGLNTISAQIQQAGTGLTAACVRMFSGAAPAIGGNILFTQGSGQRYAAIEEDPDADPSYFEGNLLVSVGVPPYRNHPDDYDLSGNPTELGNPSTESELNNHQRINSSANRGPESVILNRLLTGQSALQLLVNAPQGDYHLVHPLAGGEPNPAKDAGDYNLADARYGPDLEDIDGDRRPSVPTQFDLGADEF